MAVPEPPAVSFPLFDSRFCRFCRFRKGLSPFPYANAGPFRVRGLSRVMSRGGDGDWTCDWIYDFFSCFQESIWGPWSGANA